MARHDTSGGSNWRTHTITPAEMTAAGLTFTANMYVRFTANDDGQQTVVEAAVDAIRISVVRCGLGSVGTSYCGPADPNSTGQPGIIAAIGSDQVVDDDLIVLAGQLPLAEFAILLTSPVRGGSTRSGTITSNGSPGPLCIGVPFGISPQTAGLTDGAGEIEFPVDLSDVPLWSGSTAVMPGQTWYFQVAYRDGLARRLTDALAIQFQ